MTEAIDASAVADAIANVVGGGAPSNQPGMGLPPPALPEGWVVKASRSNPGCYYYYHMIMGIASWQPPVVEQQEVAPAEERKTEQERPSKEKLQEEPDPEVAPDRSSKRQKPPPQASSSDGPTQVRVLHILKKHKDSRRPSSWRQPKITQTKEEAKEEILGLLEILQEEEANPEELQATFEELARTESDCSSAKRGGDLGFFGRRKMQPEFEAASFGLKIGELTKETVETSSGVHLIYRIG